MQIMKRHSSPVTSLHVLDPEMLVAAIRDAHLETCQLSSSPALSSALRVECPRLCLDLVSLGPAMLFSGAMPGNCYALSFVLACPGGGHSFNFAMEHTDGYMGFFPPGGVLDSCTPKGCVNGSLTVPIAEFEAAVARNFPEIPDPILAQGAGLRVGPDAQVHLRALLAAVQETVREGMNPWGHAAACRSLESELLNAFLAALRSAFPHREPRHTQRVSRRLGRLRQARDFIAAHMHQPLHLEDLCLELGLSAGGTENLFRDFVGLGPIAFLRHQRLHRARRALVRAQPAPGGVKKAALEAGFWHLGRFSRDYRAFFGEPPSETLAQPGRL
jgi:AraC-like DNA-binding protein